MGLLTTPGKTAISNGNPIRQYWSIWTPGSNAPTWASGYSENAIHGGSSSGESAVAPVVIDAGSRTQTAYNVALRDLGDLDAGEYTITVDVSNGKFNSAAGGYFRNGSYEADPQQCILEHQVYVVRDDGTNESLSTWRGRITRFSTESFRDAGGTIKQTVGAITARPMCADILEQKWGVGDKHEVGNSLATFILNNMVFVKDDIEFVGLYVDRGSYYDIGWDYALTAYLTNEGYYKVFASIEVLNGGVWTTFIENLTSGKWSGSRLSHRTHPTHSTTTLPGEARISFWVYQDGYTNRGALVRPPKTPSTVWSL